MSRRQRLINCLEAENLRSLRTHVISLILSALSFFVASVILSSSHGTDKGAQVAKVILWYSPLLFEVAMHFLAMSQPGHVLYPIDRVFERSAAVFVIILGGGKFGAKSNCLLCSMFAK